MTPASGRSECVHATCAGDVVAVGDGRVGGITQDFTLQEGDTILYSKFGIGATDISVQGDLHVLIREDDVIGTLPRSGATAADVPELKPLADRVLLKVKMPLAINARHLRAHTAASYLPMLHTPPWVHAGRVQMHAAQRQRIETVGKGMHACTRSESQPAGACRGTAAVGYTGA